MINLLLNSLKYQMIDAFIFSCYDGCLWRAPGAGAAGPVLSMTHSAQTSAVPFSRVGTGVFQISDVAS